MSDSDREFDSFPRLEFLPNPPLGTAALRDRQVIQIEFRYNFILLTRRNGHQTTIKINPELFDQPNASHQLGYLFLIIQEDYKELCRFLLEPSVRPKLERWMDEGKTWLAESRQKIEKARQLEEERLKKELENAIPKSVRDVIKYSRQNDHVIVKGRINQRSLPISATRNDIEYTAYNFTLVDLDDSAHRIPVRNLPVGDYDNGSIIIVSGNIIQILKRGKAYIEIDGLDVRIEQPKFIPSDPLEKIRALVFEIYRSHYPNEIKFAKVLEEIYHKYPEFAKILDPLNTHIFTTEKTIPKRINQKCCERRLSDNGYLERGSKWTPLTYRWVKNEDEKKL